MTSGNEKLRWYLEHELRPWKRLVHTIECVVVTVAAFSIAAAVYVYGDGTYPEPVFLLFTLVLATASAGVAPMLYQPALLRRWQVKVVLLGLGCGVGLSAIAGLLLLELQHAPM